jgi:hypothetical protein
MTDEIYYKQTFGDNLLGLHSTEVPSSRAQFAMKLMDHLSIVLGDVDGEDSAGRQKIKVMAPRDVAARACAIADAAYEEFRTRGWLLTVPSYEECKKLAKLTKLSSDKG